MNKKLIYFIAAFGVFAAFILWFKSSQKGKLYEVMPVPKFSMTDQNNQIIDQNKMLGKVYVVEFFFTSCPTICPVMNKNLRDLEDSINNENFGIISITIDPKRDTPERLAKHAQQIGVKSPNWHFLTADRSYIQELSKQFNIYVGEDQTNAEDLNHSGKFALVDKNGKIRSRYGANNVPMLYYSGLNYLDKEGKQASLSGTFHPEMNMLKEDILKLLQE